MPKFPAPTQFADKYQEREYLKGRLALAFRIFAKLGFDEGVAGHITLRVGAAFLYFSRWVGFGFGFGFLGGRHRGAVVGFG